MVRDLEEKHSFWEGVHKTALSYQWVSFILMGGGLGVAVHQSVYPNAQSISLEVVYKFLLFGPLLVLLIEQLSEHRK